MKRWLGILLVLLLMLTSFPLFPVAALADDPQSLALNVPVTGAITSSQDEFEYSLKLAKDTKLQVTFRAYSSYTNMMVVVNKGEYWDDDLEEYVPYEETVDIAGRSSPFYPVTTTKTIYLRKGSYIIRIRGAYNSNPVLALANRFDFRLKKLSEYNNTSLDPASGNSSEDAYDLQLGATVKGMFASHTDEDKYFKLTLSAPRRVKLTCTMTGYASYFSGEGFTIVNRSYQKLKKAKTLSQTLVLDAGSYVFNLDNYGLSDNAGAAFYTLKVTGLSMPNLLKLPKSISLGKGAQIGEAALRALPPVYNTKLTRINPKVTWSLKSSSSQLAEVNANTISAKSVLGSAKLSVFDSVSGATGTTTLKIVPNKFLRTKPSIVKSQKTPQFSLRKAEFELNGDLKLSWFLYNNTGAPIKSISGFDAYVVAGANDIHARAIKMEARSLSKPLKNGAYTTFDMTIDNASVRGGTTLDLVGGLRLDWEGDLYVLTDMGGLKSKSPKASAIGAKPVSGQYMPGIYVPGRR